MGTDPGRHHHVHRFNHAHFGVGTDRERLGHLLRLVSVSIWYRRGWGISHDGYLWYGKRGWLGQSLNQGRSSPSRTQSHQCLFDARMGSILQSGPLDSSPILLSPRKWKSTVLGPSDPMDISYLLCNPRGWNSLARLLPNLQDEISEQAAGCCEKEEQGHRV